MMGFTLTASWVGERANFLRPLLCPDWYERFQLPPENPFRPVGARLGISNAFIAIGDRLLQPFNSCQRQALCPQGRRIRQINPPQRFLQDFHMLRPIMYYYCCNAKLGRMATNDLRYGRTRDKRKLAR